VHPPEFTIEDKELITQFMFEKLKAPGLALIDSATTALWAYGLSTATVIDVGFEKTDITPIADFVIQERARKTVHNCGGETMTQHLCRLLPDLAPQHVEALKKSPICEILPLGTPIPGTSHDPNAVRYVPTTNTEEERDALISEEEGTVNVAAIVASGKTREFLEKREKAARGEAERKLPNRERETNSFWAIDKKRPGEDEPPAPVSALVSPVTAKAPELPDGAADTTTTTTTAPPATTDPLEAEKKYQDSSRRAQEKRAAAEGIILREDETWRSFTVGPERFRAAECGILQRIADAVYASISAVEDVAKRADLWDSLIVVGNGARLRGFRDALLQTLAAKYIIPPSSGTIFSSELPTPTATGASTPVPSAHHQQQQGPNPLLVAATANSMQQHIANDRHSSHGQTPLSIRFAKMPDYFPEWKEAGFDEAGFLGAQVAAKVVFVVDQGANRGFMTRAEYNEVGPEGIREFV
jgi:actin-related protein 9